MGFATALSSKLSDADQFGKLHGRLRQKSARHSLVVDFSDARVDMRNVPVRQRARWFVWVKGEEQIEQLDSTIGVAFGASG